VIAYLYKGKQVKKRGVAMNSKEKPITTELEDEPTVLSISNQLQFIEDIVCVTVGQGQFMKTF
jgi:uncharacterized membrane protein YkgB